MSVQMRAYMPTALLRPFIEQYWEGIYMGSSSAALQQKVLPTGYIELVLHLSDARCEMKISSVWGNSAAFSLVGFWTAPFVLQFRDRVEVFCIRLKPEALYFILDVPAAEFINCSANLEEVFGHTFTHFCLQIEELKTFEERIRLADQYFLQRLNKANRGYSYLHRAAHLIRYRNCKLSVESLSNEVCISTRQLEREFKDKLGMSPKTYMRIIRLNAILQLLTQQPELNFSQLSYLGGYADQAHFIRDFKKLTGELPSAYFSRPQNFLAT